MGSLVVLRSAQRSTVLLFVQESQCVLAYEKALRLQGSGEHEGALALYEDLLTTELLWEDSETSLRLRLLVHRNAATVLATGPRHDYRRATRMLSEALRVDSNDAQLWAKLGNYALRGASVDAESRYLISLARFALHQALRLSPASTSAADMLLLCLRCTRDLFAAATIASHILAEDPHRPFARETCCNAFRWDAAEAKRIFAAIDTSSLFAVDNTSLHTSPNASLLPGDPPMGVAEFHRELRFFFGNHQVPAEYLQQPSWTDLPHYIPPEVSPLVSHSYLFVKRTLYYVLTNGAFLFFTSFPGDSMRNCLMARTRLSSAARLERS